MEYVHDPSIAKDGDTWYLFGTANGQIRDGELPIRCSQDLRVWKRCGNVFDKVPDWIKKESPATKELWAPDISYFNGEFHLYYAFSVFGKNTSGIALLTNKTLNPKSPDFHWVDHGLVLRSRLEDDFNAIDPNLVLDLSLIHIYFDMHFYPDEALLVHSFHTVVIDRKGRLAANLEGNDFTSQELGDVVQTVMTPPQDISSK